MYASIQSTLNSKEITHPMQQWLDYDLKLTPEKTAPVLERVSPVLEQFLQNMRAVILFQNTVSTLKVVVCMYFLTYIGACINFLTFLLLVFVASFTIPFVYEMKQREINALWKLTVSKVCEVLNNVWANIEPKLRDTYEKLPPVVKNPVSKFLGMPAAKLD